MHPAEFFILQFALLAPLFVIPIYSGTSTEEGEKNMVRGEQVQVTTVPLQYVTSYNVVQEHAVGYCMPDDVRTHII